MKAVQRRLISAAVIAAGAAALFWAGLTFGPQLLSAATSSSGSGSGERSEYRAGRDYFELDASITESYAGDTDRIPARLFFWYGCAACYRTDPFFAVWAERHQDQIEWLHTPAVFSAQHENHARLYFAMQRLGIDREAGSAAVYRAIHQERNFLADGGAVRAFLKRQGASEGDINQVLDSFFVTQQVREARSIAKAMRIPATPSLVIGERYLINSSMPIERILRIADHLLALIRRERGEAEASEADESSEASESS
ncbi:MAG: thiol:disulfide interchange protein DsbA/DsbL [Gammaproteobacteria bacterium AqS3]|nr:thiol:disulfide interchange protein DsbA/DsbL [Gammaproteobacteria bacterium AqS3]